MDDKPSDDQPSFTVEVLPHAAIDEMVGKIRAAADHEDAPAAVAAWREEHGHELWQDGTDHAVVGQTLMYLHRAPDGMLIPHARYPDGDEKVYTDPDHAEDVYPDHT